MKNSILIASFASLFLSLTSCKGDSDKAVEKETVEQGTACFYTYNSSSTVLEWTAFKFTEKTPVAGTFNEIRVEGMEKSDDPKKMIESLKFTISTISVETQNDDRNAKIAKTFFGTINTEEITGKVKSLGKDGKATIEIKMNNINRNVVGEYTLEDGKFSFNASIDVLDWKAGNGIEALNTLCKDLHTGTDKKSKLWSEVDLSFTTELMSDCD